MFYIYRISTGEVIDKTDDSFEASIIDGVSYLDYVENPLTPDGENLKPLKIWDDPQVRNATVPEIATFAPGAQNDKNIIIRADAIDTLENHPKFKKILKALIETLIDEVNILRAQHSLADRTLTQAIDAIKSKINAGDFD